MNSFRSNFEICAFSVYQVYLIYLLIYCIVLCVNWSPFT